MSSPQVETFLARLYSDAAFLNRFLACADQAMAEAALEDRERAAASNIDRVGLMMAARSYQAKRQGHSKRRRPFWRRALRIFALR